MSKDIVLQGGEFLIKETKAEDIFIPEEFNEEQRMIADTCKDFLESQVLPQIDKIEQQEPGLTTSLLEASGELGLLGISIPEKYDGFGQSFVTSMLTTEIFGGGASFAVSLAAHTGIGTLPVLYYGTEEQKQKYLPDLGSGKLKACYCLTEPGAGSDANSGKAKATLTEDGKHYLLNGDKMWITNGGFADIFIVFAKIGTDKDLSAFIVEKDFGGIKINPEEKKMGIKGSSTVQVFFEDCKVPVENLLWKQGGGFKIALNILNLGRIKLAGAAIGGAKATISHAIDYANQRIQFGKPIATYGAIQYKLAEMAIRTFAVESATYRASQNIEDAIKSLVDNGMDEEKAHLEGIRQFAIEAAILKVYASEVLDYVADESVQTYGGMGYSAESPVERAYRDSRINRIFEGTNEINRMLIIDMLMKRALKGELDLMGPATKVADELTSIPEFRSPSTDMIEEAHAMVSNFKKTVLMTAGAAVQKLMLNLKDEQEVLISLSNMVMDTYVAESLLLRVEKIKKMNSHPNFNLYEDILSVFLYEAAERIQKNGKDAVYSFAEGTEQGMLLMGLKRFTKVQPFNLKIKRRNVSKHLCDTNFYKL
ncbi:MAG: acyl-CoA dehydrogenase family protein [Bacteroidales bacterium]|nr:acyl-CoA dehydrogenase family protein [Bacteroidales bacterium]